MRVNEHHTDKRFGNIYILSTLNGFYKDTAKVTNKLLIENLSSSEV